MSGMIEVGVAFTGESGSLEATFKKLDTSVNVLKATVESLNKTVASLGSNFTTAIASASKSTDGIVTGQVKVRNSILSSNRELFSQSTLLDSIYNKNSKVMNSRYLSSPSGLRNALTRTSGEMATVPTLSKGGKPKMLSSEENALAQIAIKADMVSKAMDNMATKWTNVAKNAQWTGRQMTMGITTPIIGMGAAAIDMSYKYGLADQRLQKFLTNKNDFNVMKQSLESLSTQTGSTYQDLAQVAGEFEGIFGGAPGGSQAVKDLTQLTAQANLLGQVGDLPGVTNLIRMLTSGVYQQQGQSLSDSVKSTGRALQFLNSVESNAHIDLKELVNDFPDLIGIMNTYKMTVPQVTATLSSFKAAGIDTSQGANAVAAGMARITAAESLIAQGGSQSAGRLKSLKNAIENVNKILPKNQQLNFFDAKGNILPAQQTFLQLANAWTKMNDEQKTSFAYYAFGAQRYKELVPLMDQISQSLGAQNLSQKQLSAYSSDYAKIMGIAANAQKDNGKAIQDTWNKQLKALENSPSIKLKDALNMIKNLGAQIGDQLMPILLMFLDKIEKIVNWFAQLNPHTKRLIVGFALAAAGMGPLLYALAQANLLASTLVKTFITKPFKFFAQLHKVRPAEQFGGEPDFKEELFKASKTYSAAPTEEHKQALELAQQNFLAKLQEKDIEVTEQHIEATNKLTEATLDDAKAQREPKKSVTEPESLRATPTTPGKATEIVDVAGHDPTMEKAIEREAYREIPVKQAKLQAGISKNIESDQLKELNTQIKGTEEKEISTQHVISSPIPLDQQLGEANNRISGEANSKIKEIVDHHSQYEAQAVQAIAKHNTLLEPYIPDITPNPNQTIKQFLDYAMSSMKKSGGPLAPYTAATHSELATVYMSTPAGDKLYEKEKQKVKDASAQAIEAANIEYQNAIAAATNAVERAAATKKVADKMDAIAQVEDENLKGANIEKEMRRIILNDFDRGLTADKRLGTIKTDKSGQLIEGKFSKQLDEQYKFMGLTPHPTTASKEDLKLFAESSPADLSNLMKNGVLPKSIMNVLGSGVFGKTSVESMVAALEKQYEAAGGEKIITQRDPDLNQRRNLNKLIKENENAQSAIDTHQNAINEIETVKKNVITKKKRTKNPEKITELNNQIKEYDDNLRELYLDIIGYKGILKKNTEDIESTRKNFSVLSKIGPNFTSNVRKLSDQILRMVGPEAGKSSIHSERFQDRTNKGSTAYAPEIMDIGMPPVNEDFAIKRSDLPPAPSDLKTAKAFLGSNEIIARDVLHIPQDLRVPKTVPKYGELQILLKILGQDGIPPQLETKIIEMAQKKYDAMAKEIETIHKGDDPDDHTLANNRRELADKVDAIKRHQLQKAYAEAERIKTQYEQDHTLYEEHISRLVKQSSSEESILNHYFSEDELMKGYIEDEKNSRIAQKEREAAEKAYAESFNGRMDALRAEILTGYEEWFKAVQEQATLVKVENKTSSLEQAIQELGGNRGAARTIAGIKPGELVPPTGTTEATKFSTTMRALNSGQPSEHLQQQILSLAGISRLASMSRSTPRTEQTYAGIIEKLITDHLNGGIVKDESNKLEESRKQIAGINTHKSMLNKIVSNVKGGRTASVLGNKVNKWTAPIEEKNKGGILNKATGFFTAPVQLFLHPIKFTVDTLGLRKDATRAGEDAAKAAERGAAGKVIHIGKQVMLGAAKLTAAPMTVPIKALLGGSAKRETAKAGEGIAKDIEKGVENHAKSGGGGIIKTLLKHSMGGAVKLPAMQLGSEAATMATTFLPLLPVLVIVGGLIALIVTHWKDFSKEASGAVKAVKAAFGGLIKAVITPFKQVFADLGFGAKKGSSSISGMGTTIKHVLNLVTDGIKTLTKFLQPVINFIATAFGFIASVFKTVIDLISGDWKALGEDLKKVAKFFVEGILEILMYIPTQWIAYVDIILKVAEKIPVIGKHFKGIEKSVNSLHTTMLKIPGMVGNMIDKSVPPSASSKAKKNAQNVGQQIGDNIAGGVNQALGDQNPTAALGPSFSDAGDQAAKDFLGEFQNQIGKVTGDWKTAALAVFDNYSKGQTKAIDNQITNLDKLTKAQDKQFDDDKKNMEKSKKLRDEQSQDASFTSDSQLALASGNFNDYIHLQLSHINDVQNRNDQAASDALDAKKQSYDDQKAQDKQALQDKKQSLQDQLDLQKENLKEQLDTITQFAPRNAQAARDMQSQILGALQQYTGSYATTAVTQQKSWNEGWQTAVLNTQKALDDKAYWSGQDAASQFGLAIQGQSEQPGNLSGANAGDGTTPVSNPPTFNAATGTFQDSNGINIDPNTLDTSGSITGSKGLHRHGGGAIGNISQGPSDVPATLQTGEYVIQRKAVSALGIDKLHQLNQAHNTPVFHSGGPVMQNAWQNASQNMMSKMVTGWMGGGQPKTIAGYTTQQAQDIVAAQQGAFGVSDLTGSDTLKQLPTYAQQMVGAVKQGILQIIEYVMGNLPGVFLTSTISGTHANGSYHYKGQAADFDYGGSHSADDKIFKLLEPIASAGQLAELFFSPEGYSWKNGAKTAPIAQSEHYNHVHAAVADAFANGINIVANAMNIPVPAGLTGGGPGANQKLGQAMAAEMGWTGLAWNDLFKLWMQESSWRADVTNPKSGAYGIPQSLPANDMASAGPDWRTNPATQIKWGLEYIKERYGDPIGAWAHEIAKNWYHSGGLAELSKFGKGGLTLSEGPAYLHAKETVLSQPLSDNLQNFINNLPNNQSSGGANIEVNINLGSYLGSQAELRALATKIEEEVAPKLQRAYGRSFTPVVGYNS